MQYLKQRQEHKTWQNQTWSMFILRTMHIMHTGIIRPFKSYEVCTIFFLKWKAGEGQGWGGGGDVK